MMSFNRTRRSRFGGASPPRGGAYGYGKSPNRLYVTNGQYPYNLFKAHLWENQFGLVCSKNNK